MKVRLRNNRKSNRARKVQVITLENGKQRFIQHETRARHDRRKIFAAYANRMPELLPNFKNRKL